MSNEVCWGIMLIVGVAVFLFIKYVNYEYEQTRASALARLRPVVEDAYDALLLELRQRYNRIRFEIGAKEEYLQKLESAIHYNTSDAQVLRQVLSSLVDCVGRAFKQADLPLVAGGDVSQLGSEGFWRTEERYRATSDGRNPRDWDERRHIVYQRDNGHCVRCGVAVELERCHIHHIMRRSEGGTHAFGNLVTLCRSCHTVMEGHGSMRAIRPFYISRSGLIHTQECQYARHGRKVWGSVPRLTAKGLRPCRACRPWEVHSQAMEKWVPEVQRFAAATIERRMDEALGIRMRLPVRMPDDEVIGPEYDEDVDGEAPAAADQATEAIQSTSVPAAASIQDFARLVVAGPANGSGESEDSGCSTSGGFSPSATQHPASGAKERPAQEGEVPGLPRNGRSTSWPTANEWPVPVEPDIFAGRVTRRNRNGCS